MGACCSGVGLSALIGHLLWFAHVQFGVHIRLKHPARYTLLDVMRAMVRTAVDDYHATPATPAVILGRVTHAALAMLSSNCAKAGGVLSASSFVIRGATRLVR